MTSHTHRDNLIPLLNILKSMKSKDRIIILAHLDEETRDALCATINSVLTSAKVPIETKLKLKKKLYRHKDDFRHLSSEEATTSSKKKKLSQLGGNPMKVVLDAALPLLLDLFPKEK